MPFSSQNSPLTGPFSGLSSRARSTSLGARVWSTDSQDQEEAELRDAAERAFGVGAQLELEDLRAEQDLEVEPDLLFNGSERRVWQFWIDELASVTLPILELPEDRSRPPNFTKKVPW